MVRFDTVLDLFVGGVHFCFVNILRFRKIYVYFYGSVDTKIHDASLIKKIGLGDHSSVCTENGLIHTKTHLEKGFVLMRYITIS